MYRYSSRRLAVTSDVKGVNAENVIIKAQGRCRRRDGVSSKRSGRSKWSAQMQTVRLLDAPEMILRNILREKTRVDAVIANELLEEHRTDVAVTSDLLRADASG